MTPTPLVDDIHSAEVLDRWSRIASPSSSLEFRILMLARSSPTPEGWDTDDFESRRTTYREQLEAFLSAADACGMLSGHEAKDLIARLRSPEDSNFRSARSECLAAWFLGNRLRLQLQPRPPGRGGPLELVIQDPRGPIHVEVKAPCREPVVHTLGEVIAGRATATKFDDTDIIAECVRKARKQFEANTANLVFMVSDLTLPGFNHRRFLVEALYGAEKWHLTEHSESLERTIEPTGFFLSHLEKGTQPEYTRVSAVLYLEESHNVGAGAFDVNVLLVHNPFAAVPLPDDIWADIAQLKLVGEALVWSDGFPEKPGPC